MHREEGGVLFISAQGRGREGYCCLVLKEEREGILFKVHKEEGGVLFISAQG